MEYKKLLAIILLSLSFCFVSGAGYGEIPERMLEEKASILYVKLLEAQIKYIMTNPTGFLNVSFYYDPTGFAGEATKLPKSVNTRGKIFISIIDSRDQFSYKSGTALLDTFKRHLKAACSFIYIRTIDLDSDIVATVHSKEEIPLSYFYQGEYYLWDE